jgi:hypothetical protein
MTASERPAPLAIPDGWLIDPAVRSRLQRQLARADAACTAVAAALAEPPAGSSHRVCAERHLLAPETEVRVADGQSVRGAAVVRPGVPFHVGDEVIEVEHGHVLLDAGTMVHDPWRRVCAPADASRLGRPLASHPVALFLGFTADPYLADWVRSRVNALAGHDVEGRIAVPEPTGGLHLTMPCAPTRASVEALAPEVVVALDDDAAARSAAWLGPRTGLVRLTPDTTGDVSVVARRTALRLRREGLIGRGVDPPTLAELVRRLAPRPAARVPAPSRGGRAASRRGGGRRSPR